MDFLSAIAVLLAAAQGAPPPAQEEKPKSVWETLSEKLTVGGQVRFRFEVRDPQGYAPAAALDEDDDLLLERFRLGLKFALDPDLDIFFQPQDQRTFGDEASIASDEMNLDVHQAFVEARNVLDPAISLKIGRMELQYGDQRMISPLDWSNIGRAWDGVRLRYEKQGEFWVDAFWTIVKEGNGAEDDDDFAGIYASYRGWEHHEVDAYLLGRLYDSTSTDVTELSLGARLKGKTGAIDYTGEIVFQTGTVGDGDISANAFAFTLGYTFEHDWKPRVGLEYTFASGDGDATDGDRETFLPPFPFGHAFQGYVDVFAWQNGHDIVLRTSAQVTPEVWLAVDVHLFRLDESESDSWYGATGTAIRAGAAGADEELGNEIDVHSRIKIGKHVKLWVGVSAFLPGRFVDDTGDDPTMTFGFAQMVIDF